MANDVKIYETIDQKNGLKVAILIGGIGSENPASVMNEAVKEYVADKPHNVFVESGLTTPWVRVVTSGINAPDYQPLRAQRL